MAYVWQSRDLYPHPAKHHAGQVVGRIVRHASGVYSLMVGNSTMSCPQDWASSIESKEGRKNIVSITLDGDVLAALDALAEREHRSRSAMVEVIVRERTASPQSLR